jgi:DNA-binding transcriptional regulator YdaS (Cro superfamily)
MELSLDTGGGMNYFLGMETTPIDKAICAAGSRSALARIVGTSRQAVSQWKRIPVERVLVIEAATGISRYELRPDIYGEAA